MKNRKIYVNNLIPGKGSKLLEDAIEVANDGKVIVYSTPRGNVAILDWEKIKDVKLK